MGTTFVRIDDRGFWMIDGVLELWLRLLALHVEEPVESGSLASKIRDQWLLASRGYFMGCIPDGLQEAVSTPEGEKLVRDAIRSLMEALAEAPGQLNKDVLNLMGSKDGYWTEDFETCRLIEVGQAFLDLIDGKLNAESNHTSFLPRLGAEEVVGGNVEQQAVQCPDAPHHAIP